MRTFSLKRLGDFLVVSGILFLIYGYLLIPEEREGFSLLDSLVFAVGGGAMLIHYLWMLGAVFTSSTIKNKLFWLVIILPFFFFGSFFFYVRVYRSELIPANKSPPSGAGPI